jgi:hypothetical protein
MTRLKAEIRCLECLFIQIERFQIEVLVSTKRIFRTLVLHS